MLPTLIYILLKRYQYLNPAKAQRLMLFVKKTTRLLMLLLLSTIIALRISAQPKTGVIICLQIKTDHRFCGATIEPKQ